jgi:hypothetical protein
MAPSAAEEELLASSRLDKLVPRLSRVRLGAEAESDVFAVPSVEPGWEVLLEPLLGNIPPCLPTPDNEDRSEAVEASVPVDPPVGDGESEEIRQGLE